MSSSYGATLAFDIDDMIREGKGGERDVFNERPTREDQAIAVAPTQAKAALPEKATIHTSMGDIVSKTPIFTYLLIRIPNSISNYFLHTPRRLLKISRLWLGMVSETSHAYELFDRSIGYYNGILFHRIINKFVSLPRGPLRSR